MANIPASFPAALWDGYGSGRSGRAVNSNPDYRDWDEIVAEVLALQSMFIRTVTNGEGATALVPGNVVYLSAADTVKLADADGSGTRFACGLVREDIAIGATGLIQFAGVMSLTIAQWDVVMAESQPTGLTPGADYYLEDVAGEITVTAPATTGDSLMIVGYALSTTDMLIKLVSETALAT